MVSLGYSDQMCRQDLAAAGEDEPFLLRPCSSDSVRSRLVPQRRRRRLARPTVVWFGINATGRCRRRRPSVPALLRSRRGGRRSAVDLPAAAAAQRGRGRPGRCRDRTVRCRKSSGLAALSHVSEWPWVFFDEPIMGDVDRTYLISRGRAPLLHRGFRRDRWAGPPRQPRGLVRCRASSIRHR